VLPSSPRDAATTVAAIERVIAALAPPAEAVAGARVDLTFGRTTRWAGLLLLAVALGLIVLVERPCR
jgi:hypothetical protein